MKAKVAFLLLAGLLLAGCGGSNDPSGPKTYTVTVRIIECQKAWVDFDHEYVGTAETGKDLIINNVEAGDHVVSGRHEPNGQIWWEGEITVPQDNLVAIDCSR